MPYQGIYYFAKHRLGEATGIANLTPHLLKQFLGRVVRVERERLTRLSMVKIQIILFNGFDELDAIAPYEVFQNAAVFGTDVQAELVTLDDSVEVTAAHGLRVQPDAKLQLDQKLDILLVPGGGWVAQARQERGLKLSEAKYQ